MPHTRRSRSRAPRRQPKVPALNRYGSMQAHFALMKRAARRGLHFGGHPTGVKQVGSKLFLYEDIGVGCVRPRIVTRIKPLSAWNYVPRP